MDDPPIVCRSEHCGNKTIPFADLVGADEPQIPFAGFLVASGTQDALPLHLHQHRMDGALVLTGVQTHGTGEVGESLGTLLDKDAPGEDPHGEGQDGGEVEGHDRGVGG